MSTFPEAETNLIISGPAGDLEILALPVKADVQPRQAVAVVCHPHPLFGGTMTNKVVSTLVRTFSELGLATVRFNFRGVGKSEGVYADGIGEQEDLLAVVDWVKTVKPGCEIWLAGFSFGAAISAQVATKISVAQLVSIAPPVPRFDLLTLPPITCPWIVLQGDADEVVIPEDVYAWVETRNPKPRLLRMPGAGHFFHGRLLELRELLFLSLS